MFYLAVEKAVDIAVDKAVDIAVYIAVGRGRLKSEKDSSN